MRNSGDDFQIIAIHQGRLIVMGDIVTTDPRGEGGGGLEEGYLLVRRVNREIGKPAYSVYINS